MKHRGMEHGRLLVNRRTYLVGLSWVLATGCSAPSSSETRMTLAESRRRRRGRGGKKNRGQNSWVFVDGSPVGFLGYGELPSGLAPTWEDQRKVLPFRKGEEKRYATTRVRRYELASYLEHVGVDLDRVSAVHIHHGRGYAAEIAGQELREKREKVLFRFGGETFGKAIPDLKPGLDVSRSFDHIANVSVYVEKTPPRLSEDGFPELDGERVQGVPYFGDAPRRGLRIYVDDRLQRFVRRRHLRNGETLKSLLPANTGPLKAAVLVQDDERTPHDPVALLGATVHLPRDGRPYLALDKAVEVTALALFTEDASP